MVRLTQYAVAFLGIKNSSYSVKSASVLYKMRQCECYLNMKTIVNQSASLVILFFPHKLKLCRKTNFQLAHGALW